MVYSDGENLKKATAKKYIEGVSWVDVGSGGFSTIEAEYISIAFDSSDILYVVYSDFVNGYKATVKKIMTDAVQPITWYADADEDGFGDPNVSQAANTQPTGFVADNTDCNDEDATINPETIWYADTDEDGFGDAGDDFTM